jgi:hypothetical protein
MAPALDLDDAGAPLHGRLEPQSGHRRARGIAHVDDGKSRVFVRAEVIAEREIQIVAALRKAHHVERLQRRGADGADGYR